MSRTQPALWRQGARNAPRRRCAGQALIAPAPAGKEFIRVIEQTQPELSDKVSCSCESLATRRGTASRRLRSGSRRGRCTDVARAVRRGAWSLKRVGRRSCSLSSEPHAVWLCAQFLCYKQLKKFLKQLPDTSVGARANLARRRRARRLTRRRGYMPLGTDARRRRGAPARLTHRERTRRHLTRDRGRFHSRRCCGWRAGQRGRAA